MKHNHCTICNAPITNLSYVELSLLIHGLTMLTWIAITIINKLL
jgi:hypothetical protein